MTDLPCGCRPPDRLCAYHEGYRDGIEAAAKRLLVMAGERDAEAEAVIAKHSNAFSHSAFSDSKVARRERERVAEDYKQFSNAGNELRRASDRIHALLQTEARAETGDVDRDTTEAEALIFLRQECARVAHEKSGDIEVGHEVGRIDLLPFVKMARGEPDQEKGDGKQRLPMTRYVGRK
jgi:hypothetical protein